MVVRFNWGVAPSVIALEGKRGLVSRAMKRLSLALAMIALLAVIGTSLHEAMHFMVGWLLRAKPVSVNLFPRREGNTRVLGSVGFTCLNIFNSVFVEAR
jgi:hypothetical protein